jgi:Arc/MetJ-type ribon-helix-helix transcriptional regulator
MKIDDDLLEWMQKQIDKREFNNKSHGIRQCIRIAKRVYEKGTVEEMVKFLHL